jgi:hypothetical protein
MPIPLLERSDAEMARRIRKRIRSIQEVADCKNVTIGFTRKKPNIHSHVILKRNPSFEEAHTTCYGIDKEVRSLVPNSRVVIHSESGEMRESGDIWTIVKRTAESQPGSRGVQNIHLRKIETSLGVDFHLHVGALLVGKQANDLEAKVSQALLKAEPKISEVVVHQESVSDLVSSEQWGHGTELKSYLEHLSKRFPELMSIGPPTIWKMNDGLHLVGRVGFALGTDEKRVSEVKSEFAVAIRNGYPVIAKADIVEEPRTLGES